MTISLKQRFVRLYKSIINNELYLAIALTIFLVVVGSIIGHESVLHIAPNNAKTARYLSDPHNTVSFLANWDGVDYLSIARHGYTTKFLTGWLPVYPLLIRFFALFLHSYLMSALVISWVSLVGAIYFYQKITKRLFGVTDNIEALKATLFFVLFPTGIYLIAAYTESLFSFLALGAIYFALQKRSIQAALFVMIASATHINGIVILLLVLLILFEQKEKLRNLAFTAIIGSVGLLSYMAFLWYRYDNPILYVSAQRAHGWLRKSLLQNLGSFGVLDTTLAIAVLIAAIYWWSRRKSFSVYAFLYLLIPLVGGQFGGFPRYTLAIFPLQFMLYGYTKNKPILYLATLVICTVSWVYILMQFAVGYVVS